MRSASLLLAGVILTLASCLGPAPGKGPRAEAGFQGASPIIAALAAFHRDHGRYPSSLSELVPRYVHDPVVLDLRHGRERLYPDAGRGFGYRRDGDSYTLDFAYSGPGMNRCWYDSKTEKWQSIGYY